MIYILQGAVRLRGTPIVIQLVMATNGYFTGTRGVGFQIDHSSQVTQNVFVLFSYQCHCRRQQGDEYAGRHIPRGGQPATQPRKTKAHASLECTLLRASPFAQDR